MIMYLLSYEERRNNGVLIGIILAGCLLLYEGRIAEITE